MRTGICLVLAALSLLVSACGTTASAQPMDTATPPPPTAVPTETPTPVPPTPTPFPCDTNAIRLEVAQNYEEFQQASQDYEGSYTLYCTWVPEGARSLSVGIRGLEADLDVYIDMDASIIAYTNYGTWESAQDGLVEEAVTIPNPAAGVYYIQVVSFERLPSPYTLLVNVEE
ncbi:MAG TPA: PPC domain-containing protein [Patescibacteria group bacterium]|nr:PPC domain-containing protein [Patescibacteria group bacterium]